MPVNLPFSFFKRKLKSGKIVYYCRFRKENNSWTSGISTHQTNIKAAQTWAYKYLEENGSFQPGKKIKFSSWAGNFWDPEGRYVKLRRAHGHSLTLARIQNCNSIVTNYLNPQFGKYYLHEINLQMIENYLLNLYEKGVSVVKRDGKNKKLSARTVNSIRTVMKVIMGEAERLGLLKQNPASGTMKFKENPKERGTLTVAEIRELLKPDSLKTVWDNDKMVYIIFLVAISTGMRLSELIGLLAGSVGDNYIHVNHAFTRIDGLKNPKWNKERYVPLPSRVASELKIWIHENNLKNDNFVFFINSPEKPLTDWYIRRRFNWGLERIGIKEKERKNRNLTLHSLRHSLITAARLAKVDDFILRHAVGHSNQQMLDNYSDHVTADDMGIVRNFQENLFNV